MNGSNMEDYFALIQLGIKKDLTIDINVNSIEAISGILAVEALFAMIAYISNPKNQSRVKSLVSNMSDDELDEYMSSLRKELNELRNGVSIC